jgi:hypothetical protein
MYVDDLSLTEACVGTEAACIRVGSHANAFRASALFPREPQVPRL